MANQHVRGFLSKAMIVTVVVAICAASAYAILPGVESIKIAPLSVRLENSKLTGDALAKETSAAQQLFDRDTNTAYAPTTSIQVIATLENEKSLHDIKLFGSAPYRLSVDVDQAGSWVSVPGLQDVDLSSLANVWNSFHLGAGGKTERLRFTLLPIASVIDTSERHEAERGTGKPAGLSEIEIWSEGTRTNVKDASALLGALQDKTEPPSQGRMYVATPEQGVIGAPANTTDDLTDNTFTVKFPHNPANFKHIYLVYEANGIAHWVHALRQINGNAAQGGFGLPISEAWSTQREEINPAWLKQGDNTIAFAVPQGATGSYSVRNVRLMGELDIGSNFITLASSNTQEDSSQPQSVLDGDTGTGWKPYGASAEDGIPKLKLTFDKPTQVSDLKIYLANQLRGKVQVEFLKDEEHWVPTAQGAIAGKDLTVGWNTIAASSGDVVKGMRLVFNGGSGSSAEIRELVVSGSSTGHTWNSDIVASYPDAGQYYGRVTYLRGFLQPMDNGSGVAELSIAGTVLAQTDGAFGVALSKDDIGLKKQGDRTPWSVEIKARYPDGQTVTRTINLTKYADAINAKDTQLPGTYKQVATPGKHQKFEFDGAGLELSGTELDKETTLGIRTLTAKDLARFNQGMTNVTKAGHGYRFTPTPMKFKSKLQVSLPYDPALLPKGKTEKDIKTYYFDPAANRWKELQLASVDKVNKKIVSLSDHFTDMINATVTVPEHPDAVSFNPNSIKDIKAADPGAGINLIEPPKPNNMGDARLSYPIEIPPGRQGMQPNLSVNYNSSGGNGWMGLGWDLSVPSISVDTRWGVPRYSKDNETETYLLNGEMLTPLAHRGPLKKRSDDTSIWKGETVKIFHTRVEGAFSKIIRHGAAPAAYWWEVVDKNGIRYFYGGIDANDVSGKLGSDGKQGNPEGVFKWFLRQTRDMHDNTVNYIYARVCDTGTADGGNSNGGNNCAAGVPGYQLYLSQIGYTGRTGETVAPYTVDFIRASQLPGYHRRPDITVDARGGFKQVTADRLDRIDVKFNNGLVRRYDFNYQPGAFNKTLLVNVIHRGSNGSEFNRHAFTYFDEIRNADNTYAGFKKIPQVSAGDDRLEFRSMGGMIQHTALGGSEGGGTGFDGYAGIGFLYGTKLLNVGIAPSHSQSDSSGTNTFVDIDGDGLPDKVFFSGGQAFYRRNTTNPVQSDTPSFDSGGVTGTVARFAAPSASHSDSESLAVQGYLYGLTANVSQGSTRTRDMSYISDVNGDGIADLVDHGHVLFNTARNTGVAGFDDNSYLTDVPLGNIGSAVDVGKLPTITIEERRKFETDHPLMDNIRRWVAPFDGEVRVSGRVQLVDFMNKPPLAPSLKDSERAAAIVDIRNKRPVYKADGVRVSIQKNGEPPRWSRQIEATDFTEHQPQNVDPIPVKKGDRLYFRLQSMYDGAYDVVNWSPTIEYVNGGTALSFIDVQNRNAFRFQAAEDFILANRSLEIAMPYEGEIKLKGRLNKMAATNDDVTLRVTVTDYSYDTATGKLTSSAPRTAVSKKIAWADTGPIDLDEPISVNKESGVHIDFVAESAVDFAVFQWGDLNSTSNPRPEMPRLYYTKAFSDDAKPLARPPSDVNTNVPLPTTADAMMPSKTTGTSGMVTILDANGNPVDQKRATLNVNDENGQPRFTMPVKYNMETYSQDHMVSPQQPWIAPKDGDILWTPWIKIKTYPNPNPDTGGTTYTPNPAKLNNNLLDGTIEVTAKRRSELLAHQVIQVRKGVVDEATQGYNGVQVMHVKKGDEIFFDTTTRNADLEQEVESASGYIHYASTTPWRVPLSDAVTLNSHLEGSLPPLNNSGDGTIVNTPPVDGRGMLVVRNAANAIVCKKIFDFGVNPASDITCTVPLNGGEALYFDAFTREPQLTILQNRNWASYTSASEWAVPFDGNISVTPVLNFAKGMPDGGVTLNVLQNGVLAGQQSYYFSGGSIVGGVNTISLKVTAGQTLQFTYSTSSYPLSSYLKDKGAVGIDYFNAVVPSQLDNWVPQVVGSRKFTIDMPGQTGLQNQSMTISHYFGIDALFGSTFRGWSTAAYNGSGARATLPIDENLLVMSSDENAYKDPKKQWDAWPAYPVVDDFRWASQDDLWWTSAYQMSASRKGLDNLYDPRLEDYAEKRISGFAGAARPPKMSHSDIRSAGGGYVISMTKSDITMTSDLDLMDMNGDRFPDIVSPANIQYTWADGTFMDSAAGIGSARATQESSTSYGLGAGAPVSTGNGKGEKQNTGGDKSVGEASSISLSLSGTKGNNASEFDLIDINGDGLPDRVKVSGNSLLVKLNWGYGFLDEETWVSDNPPIIPGNSISSGNSSNTAASAAFSMWNGAMGGGVSMSKGHNYAGTTLIDINGDGLNDIVQIVQSQGSNLDVWLNTGAGFAEKITWPGAIDTQGVTDGASSSAAISAKYSYSFTLPFPLPPINFSFSFAGNVNQTVSQPTTNYIDINGDGFVDGVNSTKDSELNVSLNPIGRTNLLKKVARPLGASFELDYSRSGNTFDMPQSRWVLSGTRIRDGVAGDGPDMQTAYQYEKGKYDRFERDFYGYAKVTEKQLVQGTSTAVVYRSTVREYLNGNFYVKGLLQREWLRKGESDADKYTETQNTYVLHERQPGLSADAPGVLMPLGNPVDPVKLIDGTIFPELVQTEHRYFEGLPAMGKYTLVTYKYDVFGNVIHFKDAGDTGTDDDVDADITYSSCGDTYIVGKPLSITVKNGGTLLRSRQADIDCSKGNITQVRQLLENATVAATDLRYYDNGNLLSVSGPANYKGLQLTVDYQYDDQVQTHIVRIHDSYGLTSKAAYNYKYGKAEATTDTNNNVTSMKYDPFGRVENVFGPYEQGAGMPTISFEYHPEADPARNLVPYAVSRHLDRDANGNSKPTTIDTVLFTDGLKRVIQTKKSAAIHVSPMAGTQNVMTVSGRVLFDEMGRSVEQYYPVTEAGGSSYAFNPTFDNIQPTRTAYDVLDRTTSTILPDKTFTSMQYGFGADRNFLTQFMTTVIDANGRKKESYRDVRDLITTVREYNAGASIQTSYVYDPLKQITQVIDDHGNVTRVRYDNFGRRTVIDNPDTGRTETVYDLAGNVLQKISANLKGQGKSVQYDYDYNRLIAINYPTFPANNVSYAYGQSGDAYNRAGRISTVVHAAGVEARYYGKLGETVKENFCRRSEHCRKGADADRPGALPGHTILDSAAQNNSQHDIEHDNDLAPLYVTLTQYDTFGRLQRITYPDGEVLTYGYDAGGLVNSAVGVKGRFTYPYLTRLDYDKFDQRVYLKLGNGVETTYTYRQDNRRLDALQSQLPNIKHYRFQNLAYRYDNVGNILGISNNSLMPEGQKGIGEEVGGPVTQTFVYDDLYRLTQASGEFRHDKEHLNRYRMGMVYDSIHNINHKEQTTETLEQDHGKPHVDVQEDLTYRYHYQYGAGGIGFSGAAHPHAPSDIGPYAFQYDANGNQIKRRQREEDTERQIIWDEDNRMACVHEYETDHGHTRPGLLPQTPDSCRSTSDSENKDGRNTKTGSHTPEVRFTYNDRGERVYKESHENVSFYLNPHYTEKSDNAYKHILIGTTRLVTKEVEDEKKEKEDDQYYYHPDHLGSSSYVTDHEGKLEEHLEYFPFGETWVEEEGSALPIKFQFTAKELDSETGLYYFGARYYDPRMSIWQSADPILGSYLDGKPNSGVYRSENLGLYSYASLNPIKFNDPNGQWGVVGHQYTPQAAALAAGLPANVAAEFGRAAQAPDQPGESRDAMSGTSLVSQFGSFGNQEHIHNLNGGNAAQVQANATAEFKDLVNSVQLGKPIDPKGENTLHAFGDSFGHVQTNGSGKMYSSGMGHAMDSIADTMLTGAGGLPGSNPDNPYVNYGQYRKYLGALYDGFSARAQKEGYKAKMGRDEFIGRMLGGVASQPDEAKQKEAVQHIIDELKKD